MFVHKCPAHPRWKRFVGLALLVIGAARGATELTHEELLARIRKNMTETLSRLPNYTCREKVDRRIRYPFERPHEDSDLIHLEVLYVGGRELFAWPGSTRFGEKAITEFIIIGAVGTGNFGVLAKQVFSSDAAVFTWSREYSREGMQRVEFTFSCPARKI
jgi:hypothetical protein